MNEKPLGRKNYGSIGHLPNSRMGSGDHSIEENQGAIATDKAIKNKRGLEREVIVQEKLDGSNVGIARVDGYLRPLSRAGYAANTSPYEQHNLFYDWVMRQQDRFDFIQEGERVVGEWLAQAHSTRYALKHEPFVAFDIMTGDERLPYDDFIARVEQANLVVPHLIHRGDAFPTDEAMKVLGKYGFHGALDEVEGAVWRVELIGKKGRLVEFLCKYVRPDKIDGTFLKDKDGNQMPPVWNWRPETNFKSITN